MSSPNRGLRGLFTEALNEWLRFQSEVLDPEGHIRHYLGNAEVNDYSSVLNYKFPLNATVDEVTRALGWLEQADEEKAKREGKDARVLTKNNRQALITFKDGWQWQIVPEGACPDEGKAMRHCGNVPSVKKGDTLLSLREPIKKKGKKGWKPHATFILDRHGELGEMKGFANEKPAANTHKYIVELLKNDKVKGIASGGYAAEKNFSLEDLPKEEARALGKAKPALLDKFTQFELFGLTAELQAWMTAHGVKGFKGDRAIIFKYQDVEDFAKFWWDVPLHNLLDRPDADMFKKFFMAGKFEPMRHELGPPNGLKLFIFEWHVVNPHDWLKSPVEVTAPIEVILRNGEISREGVGLYVQYLDPPSLPREWKMAS